MTISSKIVLYDPAFASKKNFIFKCDVTIYNKQYICKLFICTLSVLPIFMLHLLVKSLNFPLFGFFSTVSSIYILQLHMHLNVHMVNRNKDKGGRILSNLNLVFDICCCLKLKVIPF